jgi:hypothetical protein
MYVIIHGLQRPWLTYDQMCLRLVNVRISERANPISMVLVTDILNKAYQEQLAAIQSEVNKRVSLICLPPRSSD